MKLQERIVAIKQSAAILDSYTITISEAAKQAKVSHTAIQKALASGRVEFVRHHGLRFVVELSLREYIAERAAK